MKFVYVNSDNTPDVPQRYGVMGLPTLILFKQGQPSNPLVGFQPEANIRQLLDA